MRTPRYDITPDRFMRITHPLPRQRCNVAVDNHTFVNALPWMCRTGAPWRELPECHGKWVTVLPAVRPPVQERRDRAPVRGIAGEADQRGGISATPDFLFSFSCFRALSHAARFHGSTGFFGGSPYSGRMNV